MKCSLLLHVLYEICLVSGLEARGALETIALQRQSLKGITPPMHVLDYH